MRSLLVFAALIGLCLTLSTGCGESSTKPKPGVTDTSDPSKIVVPDEMKKGTPGKPADGAKK
jgi:predicted component of type VI protein secretion system